jgi:hypothetical protein
MQEFDAFRNERRAVRLSVFGQAPLVHKLRELLNILRRGDYSA